jgi:hypothetical protein
MRDAFSDVFLALCVASDDLAKLKGSDWRGDVQSALGRADSKAKDEFLERMK